MSLLISRILFTVIILVISYFALEKVWTKKVDFLTLLKQPSEKIPIVEEKSKSDIFVDPVEIDLKTKDWNKTHVFSVRNPKQNETVFSVWLKIKPIIGELKYNDIDILTEDGKSFISDSIGGITTNYELVKVIAHDPENLPCIYLIIYRIDPLETKFFKIMRRKAIDNSESPLTVTMKILSFSNEAAPIASQNDKSALMIQPPENMKLDALSLLMKRDEK
jgi:hypothetical protein